MINNPCLPDLRYLWHAGPSTPIISHQEVQVWLASLSLSPLEIDVLRRCLSLDELQRATRYRSVGLQNNFIVTHGLLRVILGRYINKPPEQLHFDYGLHGKPILVQDSEQERIQFNLSHSRDYVLYGFALEKQVGVDLEYICPFAEVGQLANQLFNLIERDVFFALPLEQRTEMFFRHWSRTEAFLKAKGCGLSYAFEYPMAAGSLEPSFGLIDRNSGFWEKSNWSFYQWSPVPNYTAALAIEGSNWDVSCWHYIGSDVV